MKSLVIILGIISLSVAFPSSKNQSLSDRIIGGQEAYEGQFPFLAAIYYETKDGTFFCGGTLINSEWILTAGFCVQNVIRFTVHLGKNNINGNDENSVILVTNEYKLHPEFDPVKIQNNLGLIKLQEPVYFTPFIQPVQRLSDVEFADASTVIASGWGQTSDAERAPVDKVNWVHLVTLPLEECRSFYGTAITEKMVCVGGNRHQGACNGDLGGPLIHYEEGEVATLVGVASFLSGTQSCENEHPSGYTKIHPYRDWIITTASQSQ